MNNDGKQAFVKSNLCILLHPRCIFHSVSSGILFRSRFLPFPPHQQSFAGYLSIVSIAPDKGMFLADNGIKRADYFVLIAVLSWAEHENDHPEESSIKTKKKPTQQIPACACLTQEDRYRVGWMFRALQDTSISSLISALINSFKASHISGYLLIISSYTALFAETLACRTAYASAFPEFHSHNKRPYNLQSLRIQFFSVPETSSLAVYPRTAIR